METEMKNNVRTLRTPLMAAALVCATGLAAAQSQVQLYGTVDAGVGVISTLQINQSTREHPSKA